MTGLVEETALQAMSLARFAEALAEASPTPGGSCAAALPGAFAAALVSMTARLAAESDPFADLAFELEGVAAEADGLRAELLALVGEEARAFERVMEARRGGDSEEIEAAYRGAVEPPLRVCTLSLRVLELAEDVARRGNPSTAADAGVAVVLATASLEAAALGVEFELRAAGDEDFRRAGLRAVRAARNRALQLHDSPL